MPLTPAQAVQIVKDRGLTIKQHPDGGWIAQGRDGGRLSGRGSKSTYEDAVEEASRQLVESEVRAVEANKSRLFDVLSRGDVYCKMRRETVPGEGQVDAWDVLAMSSDSVIVRGERSLTAAVIAAEKAGAI